MNDRETPTSDGSGTPMSVGYEPVTVSEDASLEDFFEDGDGESEGVEEFDPIFRWTPPGATCKECGATVQRRWADAQGDEGAKTDGEGENDGGSGFVCRNCKEW